MSQLRTIALLLLILCVGQSSGGPLAMPTWLPRYDLNIHLDVHGHTVKVRQRVTWTNRHPQKTNKLVFNVHSRYQVPKEQIGFMAKTLELLRVNPVNSLIKGCLCDIQKVVYLTGPMNLPPEKAELPFRFEGDTDTTMTVKLPMPVGQHQSVSVLIEFEFKLPQKMGRWGQWQGVTFLSNWLPVLAYYDEHGWIPTPFVPWHQPFFNESGIYHATVKLPADQVIACTGTIQRQKNLGDGNQLVEIDAPGVRDFSFLCSARYKAFLGQAKMSKTHHPVQIRVLAFAEHAHYAQKMIQIAEEALPVYEKWFGPYPYPVLTIASAFFGWNGNECSTMIMIDERVFGMPHLANQYVDYLVSHEICHQWWYNVVGTNGFAETWMDESVATHFSHRLSTLKYGKTNKLLNWPKGLKWLPNINREDYRSYGLLGSIGRGSNSPVVQEIPRFKHLANLFNMAYDKGSRIIGMIEERLGKSAFIDFMRMVYHKYAYRILRVKDFQRELEEYTKNSWKEFFDYWLYGEGLSDWAVEKVEVKPSSAPPPPGPTPCPCGHSGTYRVTVLLKQKGKFAEQTTLGISFQKKDAYPIRIPILPQLPRLEVEEVNGVVTTLPDNCIHVDMLLNCKPQQITVDPDRIIVDTNAANNHWRPKVRLRLTPLYTFLEETDITNAYDRWNILAGPWFFRSAYDDPWYARTTLIGGRVGVYRTQKFNGGGYLAYRTDFRDIVAGADAQLLHWPVPEVRFGFNVEQRLATFQSGRDTALRSAIYSRYVFQTGSSLYLPDFKYLEAFGTYQDNFLPFNRNPAPGSERFNSTVVGGVHFHQNYLTPYWDPVAGIQIDVSYLGGSTSLPSGRDSLHQVFGQVSTVHSFPDLTKHWDHPITKYLAKSRIATRAYAAAALPDQADLFTMGGGTLFRGYDQADRQGSVVWIGSLEWRLPLAEDVRWDILDHTLGARNVHLALFYDAGNVYSNGRSTFDVSHALGAGLRVDTALFGFIERTTLRFDVAKTVNDNTPVQFWLGLLHPF